MNLGGCLVRERFRGRPAEWLSLHLQFSINKNLDFFSARGQQAIRLARRPRKARSLTVGPSISLHGHTEINWTSPAPFSLTRYVSWRWRLYHGYFQKLPDNDPKKAAYPRYLIQTWNSEHPKSEQVESLEILNMSDVLAADGKFRGVKPTLLWKETQKAVVAD